MKKLISLIILSVGICLSSGQTVFCQKQQTQKECEIKFDPKQYKGPYFIESDGDNPFIGFKKKSLKPNDSIKGFYTLDIGSLGYPKSQIRFVVSQNCKVRQFEKANQSAPVKFKGQAIVFRNAPVEIDPQNYKGDYFFKGFFPYAPYNFAPSRGKTIIVAVPNVDNFISVYGTGGKTEIYFDVGDDGKLSNVSSFTAASACDHTLTLNNVKISVTPATFTGLYRLGRENYRGAQHGIYIIPGIPLQIDIRRTSNSEKYVIPWVTHVDPYSIDVPDSDTTFQKFIFSLDTSAKGNIN